MQILLTVNNIYKSKHICTLLICFLCTCLGSYGKYLLSSWIFIAEFLQTKFLTFKHQQMKFMRKVLKKLPSQHWWGRMVNACLMPQYKNLFRMYFMWIYLFFLQMSIVIYSTIIWDILLCLSATVFAYGQTSSGKTYTMQSITENAVDDIFTYIKQVYLYSYVHQNIV